MATMGAMMAVVSCNGNKITEAGHATKKMVSKLAFYQSFQNGKCFSEITKSCIVVVSMSVVSMVTMSVTMISMVTIAVAMMSVAVDLSVAMTMITMMSMTIVTVTAMVVAMVFSVVVTMCYCVSVIYQVDVTE